MTHIAAVAAIAAVTTFTALPARADIKIFKDWLVGCDNTRTCRAIGSVSGDPNSTATAQHLVITRAAGADAPVTMHFALRVGKSGGRALVTIDALGARVAGLPVTLKSEEDANNDQFATLRSDNPKHTAAVVAALRTAKGIQIAAAGETGVVSLDGATAALLYIDEVQRRLNTPTALARPGKKPVESIPPAPLMPAVTLDRTPAAQEPDAKLGERLRAHLRALPAERRGSVARELLSSPFKDPRDEVTSLGGRDVLVKLEHSRGAYNVNAVFYRVPNGDVRRAERIRFPGITPKDAREVLVNAGYDAKERMIGYFSKERGLGDCGSSGRYGWTGKSFVLVEYSSMPNCEGVWSDLWPTLYRATVK